LARTAGPGSKSDGRSGRACGLGPTSYHRSVDLADRDASLLPGHNLGCRGQNFRLRGAVILVAVGLSAAVFFIKGDFPTWARAFCFVPFAFAAHLAFQGLFRTCPMHAKQGTREDDEGHVDPVVRDRDRRGARRLSAMVIGWSLGLASAATGMLFLLP